MTPQAGVLGKVERYDYKKHRRAVRLGMLFGEYESWLSNKEANGEVVAEKCNLSIELLNDQLRECLECKHSIRAYISRNITQSRAINDYTEIEDYLSHRTVAEGLYFVLGTAFGMLLYGSDQTVRDAETRLVTAVKVQYGDIINAKALFLKMKTTFVPRNGRSDQAVLTIFEGILQEFGQPIVILVLHSNKSGNIDTEPELKAISQALDHCEHAKQYKMVVSHACTVEDIQTNFDRHHPQIVHFTGHAGQGGLMLRNEKNVEHEVQIDYLGPMMEYESINHNLQVFCLNTCATTAQCDALKKFINVISMGGKIHNDDAIKFAKAFYSALGSGKPILVAFEGAKQWFKHANRYEQVKPTYHQAGQQGELKLSEDPEAESGEARTELYNMTAEVPPQSNSSMQYLSAPSDAGPAENSTVQHKPTTTEALDVATDETSQEGSAQDLAVVDKIISTLDDKDVVDASNSTQQPVSDGSNGETEVNAARDDSEFDSGLNGEDDDQTEIGSEIDNEVYNNTDGTKVTAVNQEVSAKPFPESQTVALSSATRDATTSASNGIESNPTSSATRDSGPTPQLSSTPATTPATTPALAPQYTLEEIKNILPRILQDKDFQQLRTIAQRQPQLFPKAIELISQVRPDIIRVFARLPGKVFLALLEGEIALQRQPPVQRAPARRAPADPFAMHSFFRSDPFFRDPFAEVFGMSRDHIVLGPRRAAHQPLSRKGGQRVASSVKCDQCNQQFGDDLGYHCQLCKGGDFDVCAACVSNNVGCLDRRHRLVAWKQQAAPAAPAASK